MGAVESLDKTNKKYLGSWRTPPKKAQKIDLNRDYGNGAAICDDPLKDLKLDKSIDAELAAVCEDVGHRFPMPIHGQEKLLKLLEGFKKRGYSFPGTNDKVCARVRSMHPCKGNPAVPSSSRVNILQFRAWFQAEVVSSQHNLRTLLRHSRWFSAMVKRMHSECDFNDDGIEHMHDAINTMRYYLAEKPISTADIRSAASKVNHCWEDHGEILSKELEAVLTELLVQMYYDHFSASCHSLDREDTPELVAKKMTKARLKHLPGSSACCLPTTQSGIDTWCRVSESLPVGPALNAQKPKTLSGSAAALGSASIPQRSLKFPVGAVAA